MKQDAGSRRFPTALPINIMHCFWGAGSITPSRMEGALKLKEISYIHAEAYPAGELKHGPLALVDEDMPVVAVAPDDRLMEKLRSNLEEVRARGGQLFVFASENAGYQSGPGCEVLEMPACGPLAGPIVFTIACSSCHITWRSQRHRCR